MTKAGAYISAATVARVMKRDGRACVYCGATRRLTIDHVTPRSWRGTNAPSNLVTACATCNSVLKSGLDLVSYARKLRALGGSPAAVRAMIARVRAAQRRPLPKP